MSNIDLQIQSEKEAKLSELISAQELCDSERQWLTKGNTLKRYLVANKWKVDNAFTSLKSTIEWRREAKPHEISLNDVYEEARQGNIYQNGTCKEGRPVMIVKKRGVLTDPAKQLKLYIYTMEKAIASMKDGVYQVIMIFDMEKYSRANSPPISVTLELLDILSRHYPERMYTTFFVYQPWIFNIFYNILWPFMDNRQREKLNIIGTDFEKILKLVDQSQLETKYGGDLEDQDVIDGEQSVDTLG